MDECRDLNDDPDMRDMAVVLRDLATHVRRIMAELVFEADRRALREYAEELEARAAELNRGEG